MIPVQLLIWLSVAYAAVLVVALAVSLILILVHLMRVRAALQPVAAALGEVADRTAALDGVMQHVTDTATRVHGDIERAADAIVRAGGVIGVEPPKPPPVQAGAVARWQEGVV